MGGWWFEDEYGRFVHGASGSLLTALEEDARRLRLPTLLRLVQRGRVRQRDMKKLIAECKRSNVARALARSFAKVPPDSGIYITDLVDPEDEA